MALALQPIAHNLLHQHSFQLRPNIMDQLNTTRPSLPSISSLIEAVNDQADGGQSCPVSRACVRS